jgi:hypothetical protein
VLKKACGGARAKRRCIYKTDFPCGPGTFNTTDNSSDPHLQYLLRSTMPHRSMLSHAHSLTGRSQRPIDGAGTCDSWQPTQRRWTSK